MLTDDNDSGAVAWRARAESQGGNWALCYDSSTDCTACPSATFTFMGDFCSCPSGSTTSNTFHGGCDAYTQTVVIGHNSLDFGNYGAPGYCAICRTYAGSTYAGHGNDVCGGHGNWGATEMEVWYRVGS